MLSNPTNLHLRQRQHRRQQSTPTIFDHTKVSALPTPQRHGSHRRGMSLDQRRRRTPPQDNRVSITNTGLQDIQQHVLQETQQQRLSSPGQLSQSPYFNLANDENYLASPLATPQRSDFDTGFMNIYGTSQEPNSPYSSYSDQVIQMPSMSDNLPQEFFSHNDSMLFAGSDNLANPAYLNYTLGFEGALNQEEWCATIKPRTSVSTSRRLSGGIAERVAKFENLASQPSSRPTTPPHQNASNYLPPTPAQTPYSRGPRTSNVLNRFSQDYDTSMEATIKPTKSRNNQKAEDIFHEIRANAKFQNPPSPPNSAPIPSASTFNSARMPPSNVVRMPESSAMFKQEESTRDLSHYTPDSSQQSSPEIGHLSLATHMGDKKIGHQAFHSARSSVDMSDFGSTDGFRRFSDSLDEYQREDRSTSVESFSVEATATDTGITIDDIACYIEGPDPVDQKWLCLFPDCKKKFGRKENIKSHVQTHLGDRQFQCPHCRKCFVRQHDLKRHAKIHSGVKPYPCACGNSFARHDALTRHRQRGMCIGAFEGVVKKVVKRGRPRKERPDVETRISKASRTRSKNKAMSSASSTSAYSESSYGQSPHGDFDMMEEGQFGNYDSAFMMDGNQFGYSPPPSGGASCVSPQAVQNAPSPAYSTHSHFTSQRTSVVNLTDQNLPSQAASPAKSHYSQYNTPPELCLSSSSPPASQNFYDMAEGGELDIAKLGELGSSQHDEMFLDAFSQGNTMDIGLSRLEQDPDLLLMGGKFDDAFAVVDNEMFTGRGDDVFFGSP